MSRLPLNNLIHAAAMAQHVPQWLREQLDRYEWLCAELRHVINDGDKAEAIIDNVRHKAQSSIHDNLTYSIQLLEEKYQLALRGGYDDDYGVWRYSEDDSHYD